jgi:hypothetical protein
MSLVTRTKPKGEIKENKKKAKSKEQRHLQDKIPKTKTTKKTIKKAT